MFSVYAVVMDGGEKHRHFIGHEENEFMAKHRANVATCGFADYAYVKDGGDTVFFIRRPDYDTQRVQGRQPQPLRPAA